MSLIRKPSVACIILQPARWYLAYALSLRDLEEMMAERGIIVDHTTLHRWVTRLVPLPDKTFRRHKPPSGAPLANGRNVHPGQWPGSIWSGSQKMH